MTILAEDSLGSTGQRVKSGSVFKLHPEVVDDWLKWSPEIWRGGTRKPTAGGVAEEEHHGISAFFHHEGKSEDEATVEHHPKDDEKHGFFHRLFN